MKTKLWELHDHYLELNKYYTKEAAYYSTQEQYSEGQYWAGKAYAMQYAAFLLAEELLQDA